MKTLNQYVAPRKQRVNFANSVNIIAQIIIYNMTEIFELSHQLKLTGDNAKSWKDGANNFT